VPDLSGPLHLGQHLHADLERRGADVVERRLNVTTSCVKIGE